MQSLLPEPAIALVSDLTKKNADIGRLQSIGQSMRTVAPFAIVWLSLCVLYLWISPNFQLEPGVRAAPYGSDFLQEWVGGSILDSASAADLYKIEFFRAWQHDPVKVGFQWTEELYYPPVYPPTHYWLCTFLSRMTYPVALYFWLTVLALALPIAAWLVEHKIIENRDRWISNIFWISSIAFPAVLFSWVAGQKGALILLLLAVCCLWMKQGFRFQAGLVFGLLSIKPTLFFLIPVVMLLNREWRFVFGATLSAGVLLGITALLVPMNLWSDYLKVVLNSGSYQTQSGYNIGWSCSVWSLFRGWNPVWKFSLISMLALPLLYRLRNESNPNTFSSGTWLFKAIAATCLLSPHFYFYDLMLLLLPLRMILQSQKRLAIHLASILFAFGSLATGMQNELTYPILPIGLLLAFWTIDSEKNTELVQCGFRKLSGFCTSNWMGLKQSASR